MNEFENAFPCAEGERLARQQAEALLEEKSFDLDRVNQEFGRHRDDLEQVGQGANHRTDKGQ
ncbi:MAG: hypothetical protein ABIP48_00175 [Planctomycetota bacterium]